MIRVLIADDHALVREGLRILISATNDIKCVGMVNDGVEVVTQIEKVHPDIVIVDIEMPTVDGIEATKQIKAKYPHVAVLILSAYNYPEYVQACMDAGADGYLLKCNAETDAILGTIRAIHLGKKVLDEQVFSHFKRSGTEESKKPDYSDKHRSDSGLTRREFEVIQLVANKTNQAAKSTLKDLFAEPT